MGKYIVALIFLIFPIINLNCQSLKNDSLSLDFQKHNSPEIGTILFLHVDYHDNDFTDFMPLLDTANINLLNSSSAVFNTELSVTFGRYYSGFSFGYSFNSDDKQDSMDIEVNTTQYGLHFGYNVIDNNRFIVTPKIAIKWNRYRLINSDSHRRIPLQQYIYERDLDLRFNQVTGSIGMNISYKMYTNNYMSSDFWTFGIYGGYVFAFNDKPWVYSKRNRLTTENKTVLRSFTFGIFFSFNSNY